VTFGRSVRQTRRKATEWAPDVRAPYAVTGKTDGSSKAPSATQLEARSMLVRERHGPVTTANHGRIVRDLGPGQ